MEMGSNVAAGNASFGSESIGGSASWVRIWLACVACWYPFWWAAGFLIFVAPALAYWFVRGTSLDYLRISLWLPVAVGQLPRHSSGGPQFFARSDALAIVAGILIAAWLIARKGNPTKRVLAGLAAVVAAAIGMLASITTFGGPRLTVRTATALALFFGAMLLGFLWMLDAWRHQQYWARVLSLAAAFELPLALLLIGVAASHSRAFGPLWWQVFYLVPGAAAVLLASRLWKPREGTVGLSVRWRAIVNGAVVTVLLAVGVGKLGPGINHWFDNLDPEQYREAVAELPPVQADEPYPKIFFQKGVSLSAEWPAPYGSEGAREMLLRLQSDGVNAVALVPYAAMRPGSPEVRTLGPHSMESDDGLEDMARLAHGLGMKVMLKPGIWVRDQGYAGEVDFSTEVDRTKFFTDYGKFIDHYARLATKIHADLFCVGGEFVKLSQDEQAWRSMIAHVRELYPGPLTYAANFGTEFETLKFWDALDYIGLQDYYPLPASLSLDEEVAKVEAVQQKYGRPVILTEVGFASAPDAYMHPWQDGNKGRAALDLQARCYAAIFRAFYSKPWFEGMYWWKVGTDGGGGPGDTSLTPWNKPAMEVVKQWYESKDR